MLREYSVLSLISSSSRLRESCLYAGLAHGVWFPFFLSSRNPFFTAPSPPHRHRFPPQFCSAQLSSPLHCRIFFLARTFSSSCVLRLTPEARVRCACCACRVFTTFVRLHGTPPSFGYSNIFGGYPDATSLRDTIPLRSCTSATPLVGLRARLGSGLDPSLPHHLGSSIGQAFHAPPAAA
jgi:hypothetical protein